MVSELIVIRNYYSESNARADGYEVVEVLMLMMHSYSNSVTVAV